MRIAIVATTLPPEVHGGAELYAADLAAALAEHHEVCVLSGAPADAERSFRVATIPRLRPFAEGTRLPRRTLWHLRDQWIRAVHIGVRTELERFRPAVVHSHQVQGLSAAVFTAIRSAGVPHVHTAHDYGLLCARVTLTKDRVFCGGRCLMCAPQRMIRSRLAARHLQRFVAPSDYARDVHVRAGIVPAEHAVTIRQGASPGTTRLRGAGDGPLTIGFIGTLAPHKGVQTLLEAFADAPSDWRLRIAGRGTLGAFVEQAAARDDRLDFVGSIPAEERDRFYDSLDCLVVPSEWEENAPLVTVEAAVRGLPAVVSDRGGLPETPEAKVFRALDAVSLLDAVAWFSADGRLRDASERLLARRSDFEWPTHVSRVERTLADVAAGR
jgi:glycosyltransferase involved in cell wall biosynthesis